MTASSSKDGGWGTRPCKNCDLGLHPEDQDLCKKCQQISKLVNEKEALEEENNRYKKELAEAFAEIQETKDHLRGVRDID